MTPHNLLIFASTLLVMTCDAFAGRPDFYARPIVQYTWLPSASRLSTARYDGYVSGTPGAAYSAYHYTASGSGVGGGLSAGLIWGKNNSFEFGGEGTITRFAGSYLITQRAPVDTGTTTHACSFKVRSLLAAFRHHFGQKDSKICPYYGAVLGMSLVDNSSPERPPSGGGYSYSDGEGQHLTAGLGIGMSYKVGQRTQLEVGYRFTVSGKIAFMYTAPSDFLQKSHTLNFSLRQHF